MLDVAKKMIAGGAPEAFTIRELGHRAGVSVTTIYATYGDKEGLIAAAIEDFYRNMPFMRRPVQATLDGILNAADEASKVIFGNKPYARHYADLYFSTTVDPRIYKVVQDTTNGSAGYLPWLEKTMSEGGFLPGLDLEYLTAVLANNRLIALRDWEQGRIEDRDLADTVKISFLVLVRGVTQGKTQKRVEAALRKCLRVAATTGT